MSTTQNLGSSSAECIYEYVEPPSTNGPDGRPIYPPFLLGDDELGLFPGFVTLSDAGTGNCYMRSNKHMFLLKGDFSWVRPDNPQSRFLGKEHTVGIKCCDGQVKDRTCFWTVTVGNDEDIVTNPNTPYKATITITQVKRKAESSSMVPESSSSDDSYGADSWSDSSSSESSSSYSESSLEPSSSSAPSLSDSSLSDSSLSDSSLSSW